VHVSEEGRLYAAPTVSVPATVDGLLDAWLNVQKNGAVKCVPPPESITLRTPNPKEDGTISWHQRTVPFGPATYLPFSSADSEGQEVTMTWPQNGSPSAVSPEAESARQYSSEKFESDDSIVVTEQGDLALHYFIRWPGLVELVMPILSGVDDMFALVQMTNFARQSASDLPGASRAASIAAQPYLSRGYSAAEHTWLRPLLQQKGMKAMLFQAEDRNLPIPQEFDQLSNENAVKELLKNDAWRTELEKPFPIRRAWGAVGLFWTLLLDRLEAQRSFNYVSVAGASSHQKPVSDSVAKQTTTGVSVNGERRTNAVHGKNVLRAFKSKVADWSVIASRRETWPKALKARELLSALSRTDYPLGRRLPVGVPISAFNHRGSPITSRRTDDGITCRPWKIPRSEK
jgi:hypothetical protein